MQTFCGEGLSGMGAVAGAALPVPILCGAVGDDQYNRCRWGRGLAGGLNRRPDVPARPQPDRCSLSPWGHRGGQRLHFAFQNDLDRVRVQTPLSAGSFFNPLPVLPKLQALCHFAIQARHNVSGIYID